MKIIFIKLTLLAVLIVVVQKSAFALDASQISCLIEPSEKIKIASQVQGVVKSVNGERGDSVKKGEVLITLEQGLEVAEVNQAQAKVEFSKRKLDRNQELIKDGLLTANEADEILTEYEVDKLELKIAEAHLEQKIIYSPVSGVITDRLVSKGEYAGIEPLMILAVLDPLHAEVIMDASLYGTVKKGMKVEVIPDGRQNETHAGVIKIVDRIIDAASSTFGVQVELPNPDFKITAGLKCNIHYPDN